MSDYDVLGCGFNKILYCILFLSLYNDKFVLYIRLMLLCGF